MSLKIRNYRFIPRQASESGFTIVELLVAIVIFPLLVVGMSSAYNSARHIYTVTRQLNEMYAVLSSCPELDRGIEFTLLGSSNNCIPNNTFAVEDGSSASITYSPVLTLTDTSSLPPSDPLSTIPDSKVINVSVGWPAPNAGLPPVQLRLMISRNGIGQE